MIKLNNKGISHLAIPFLVILVIAIGGTYFLVASHADPANVQQTRYYWLYSQARCPAKTVVDVPAAYGNHNCKVKQTVGFKPKTPSKKQPAPATTTVPSAPPASPGTGTIQPNNNAGQGTMSIIGSSQGVSMPKPQPSGDIIVITYVNDPDLDKKGDKDKRIGGIKVKVEKIGGANNCDNRSKQIATTNKTKTVKQKGKKVLVHGTAHFLNCDAGKYKVSLVKPYRRGYVPESATTREFQLKNDETEMPYFVFKKASLKSSGVSASSSSGQSSGTEGVEAP